MGWDLCEAWWSDIGAQVPNCRSRNPAIAPLYGQFARASFGPYHLADGPGCVPVYGEQHGSFTGANSMNSTRVPSGSLNPICIFPSTPSVFGSLPAANFQPRSSSFFSSSATLTTPGEKWFAVPNWPADGLAGSVSMYSIQSVPSGTCIITQFTRSGGFPPCQYR